MTLTILQNAVRTIRPADRESLRDAYDNMAVFCHDMSRVMMAEIELEECAASEDVDDTAEYWRKERVDALGSAYVAMEKVPIKWLAILLSTRAT